MSFITKLKESYLECRTMRHAWRVDGVIRIANIRDSDDDPWYRKYRNGTVRMATCRNCGAFREDIFATTDGMPNMLQRWRLVARRYGYPPGYTFDNADSNEERPRFFDYTDAYIDRMLDE